MNKKFGFTLIELLIVVAIIGILAAIAVPNFLNAQTRAMIARCYSDLKAISVGQEEYFLDNNRYTYPFMLHPLTSPIAYLSSIQQDVFAPKAIKAAGQANGEKGAQWLWYRYVYGTDDTTWGGSAALKLAQCADYYAYFAPFTPDRSYAEQLAAKGCPTKWLVKSFGPNCDGQGLRAGYYGDDYTLRFDASNGIKSTGDIAVFGPGGMIN